MDKLENKYVDLILQKGLGGKDLDSLLIQLDLKEHIPFALKVKDKAGI